MGTANVAPVGREQVSLMLMGRSMGLVATATSWVARRDGAELKVIEDVSGNTWTVYDGAGLTYTFSNTASTALAGAGMWLLTDMSGPGGNKEHLDYSVTTPTVPDGSGLAIDLTQVSYNPAPSIAGCYKNTVSLTYTADDAAPQTFSMLGDRVLTRLHSLKTVDVSSKANCAANATVLRSYTLAYLAGGDPDTHQPRLQSVTMKGQAGTPEASVTLPVATYTYSTATTLAPAGAATPRQLSYADAGGKFIFASVVSLK